MKINLRNKSKKFSILDGEWELSEDYSRVRMRFQVVQDNLKIDVYNYIDNEVAEISDLNASETTLQFKCFWQSTKYETRHRITLLSNKHFSMELTTFEKWTKVAN